MADVFLSYSHLDVSLIRPLLNLLETNDLTVWWDTRLRSGDLWDATIEHEISIARCVVVVWSCNSVTSHWVRSEADYALKNKKLFPVLMDGADLPLAFRLIQTPDFSKWAGNRSAPEAASLLNAITTQVKTWERQPTAIRSVASPIEPVQEWNDKQQLKVDIGLRRDGAAQWITPGSGAALWFRDLDFAPEMVVIPAGAFTMGAPPEELQSADYERPQRVITFSRAFAVSRCCITFAEWDRAVHDRGVTHNPDDRGWGRNRRPIINVSWDDALTYVAWLSRKTDRSYYLLSESQWEYCCRAGSTSQFNFGDRILPELANYDSAYSHNGSPRKHGLGRTVEVDRYQANAWGLSQMHGNVREWCDDMWNANYVGGPSDGTPWRSGDAKLRVVRGGSWKDKPENLRSADRDGLGRAIRAFNVGFRVARTIP